MADAGNHIAVSMLGVSSQLHQEDLTVVDQFNVLAGSDCFAYLMALVSMGDSLATSAKALGMTTEQLKIVLMSTTKGRHDYMLAQVVGLSQSSAKTLSAVGNNAFMMKEDAAAATHHRAILALAMKESAAASGIGKTDPATTQVVVHSNISIGAQQTPPPLPTNIQGIIDHA